MLSFGISWALSYFCATVWPTYASFKALGTRSTVDDTQWLTYWVVYSVLTTLEAIFVSIVTAFPLYYEIRLLFVLWLVLPQTKGAQLVYERYIQALMERYSSTIDPAFRRAEQVMNSQQVNQIVQLSQQYGPQIASQALQIASEEAQKLASGGGATAATGRRPDKAPTYQAPNSANYSNAPPGYSQPVFGRR